MNPPLGGMTVKELGISKTQAYRQKKMAEIPDEDFEAFLRCPDKPATNGIIRKWHGIETQRRQCPKCGHSF